ncbi:hypothetical protein ACFXKG_28805 [Streptomyces sp. NPDC059255]|uniref:hypothetical protein n=1 Tax=Streptomyces sp. NPDC059255 TaxID=3346793 RepID=UPI00368B144C
MFTGYAISAVLVALLLSGSAWGTVTRNEKVTVGLAEVGIADRWFLPLGLIKFAGAA